MNSLDNGEKNLEEHGEDADSEKDVEMSDFVPERSKSVARSALFGDEMEQAPTQLTKPVILQHRVASLASLTIQPRVIECIANSVLGPAPAPSTRGLGGVSMISANNSGSYMESSSHLQDQSINISAPFGRPKTAKLASYTLQGGYDKFVTLPGLEGKTSDQHTVFVPQHVDTELTLGTSLLGGKVKGVLGDMGLKMGKTSRAGWGVGWDLVSAGQGVSQKEQSAGTLYWC